MDFPRRNRGDGHEPVIPLINVIFLLLIFFLVTGTLRSAELFDVAPPLARSGIADDSEVPAILVGADGRLALNGDVVELNELAARLGPAVADRSDVHVVVKADGGVPSEVMLTVFDQVERAGVHELSLVTEFAAEQ